MFNRNYKIYFIPALLGLNFSLFLFSYGAKSDELKIYVFDIGQGDAIFIEAPNGKQVLIDGGPDNSVIQKLSEAMPFWDRTIDLVILTHPERDHLAGLVEVLKRYKVLGILESGIECGKPDCLAWEEEKQKERAADISAELGQSIVLDKDLKLLILHPFESLADKKVSKANNTSIVAKLIYGSYNFLLTGDIEDQVENKLILAGIDINADYLKIPHHGSKTSTTEGFLNQASPLSAFISVGKDNSYGHPNDDVIGRLEKNNIKYYRTDELGTILLTCKLNSPCQIE